MKPNNISLAVFVALILVGCEVPQIYRPLRLYDLVNGNIIEVFLRRNSPQSGRLVSARVEDERFEGEIVLYTSASNRWPGPPSDKIYFENQSALASIPDTISLPELYGFGKDADARPVGTAILVGTKGTIVEIVLYSISPDLQFGDGVARDNRGRHYRVFLSVENQ